MSYNFLSKLDLIPTGFILQKDVYTTNLLYANNQFPLKSLRQRLPFRYPSPEKENPNYSVTNLRHNESSSILDIKNNDLNYSVQPKIKNLKKILKMKYPIPKGKIISLKNLNFYQEMNDKNIRVKNIDDDLNITSNKGRKILYKFKNNKSNMPILPLIPTINDMNNQIKKEKSMNLSNKRLKNMIDHLNDELKNIKIFEAKRKQNIIRDKFFNTQIYVNNIIKSGY